MNLTPLEQKFVTHIRTLLLKKNSSFKDKSFEYVSLAIKEIKNNYFGVDYEPIFQKLKKLEEIDFKKTNKENGSFFYSFKTLKDGAIDFSLLKISTQKLDNLQRMLKANLRWVSLENEIESTIYFTQFLKQKEKNLDAFFIVDKFSGRIHTPITSLQGSIRKHLLIKNENVVSLDVAQIQPLLLSSILNDNIGSNEFTEWIEQGEDIYLKFKEKLNLQNRDEAKTKFYEITFGKANNTLAEMFGNSNWIKWVNEFKSTSFPLNPNTQNKPHSNLAWLLQTTEVSIMRSIWQKLIDNDILFLTVHDEIIVRESDVSETLQIMEDELRFNFNTFKVNVKEMNDSSKELSLDEKINKIPPCNLYYPYELAEKFNLSLDEIMLLVNEKKLEEIFPECYRIIKFD
jgi:hypothetical protein